MSLKRQEEGKAAVEAKVLVLKLPDYQFQKDKANAFVVLTSGNVDNNAFKGLGIANKANKLFKETARNQQMITKLLTAINAFESRENDARIAIIDAEAMFDGFSVENSTIKDADAIFTEIKEAATKSVENQN